MASVLALHLQEMLGILTVFSQFTEVSQALQSHIMGVKIEAQRERRFPDKGRSSGGWRPPPGVTIVTELNTSFTVCGRAEPSSDNKGCAEGKRRVYAGPTRSLSS